MHLHSSEVVDENALLVGMLVFAQRSTIGACNGNGRAGGIG